MLGLPFIHLLIYKILSPYDVLGTVQGIGYRAVSKTDKKFCPCEVYTPVVEWEEMNNKSNRDK